MTEASIVTILKAPITAQMGGRKPEAERFFKEALDLSEKRRGRNDDLTILIRKCLEDCKDS